MHRDPLQNLLGNKLALLQVAEIDTEIQLLDCLFHKYSRLIALAVPGHGNALCLVANQFGNIEFSHALLLEMVDHRMPEAMKGLFPRLGFDAAACSKSSKPLPYPVSIAMVHPVQHWEYASFLIRQSPNEFYEI